LLDAQERAETPSFFSHCIKVFLSQI
jgi:hypothetical protein